MEKKFTEGQEVWVKATYENKGVSEGVHHVFIEGNFGGGISVEECNLRTTEPDTELSDILQTPTSPKRKFVESVAPAFFQAMVSDPKNNVAYIETAVEKAAKMWDYIQSSNF